MRRTLKGSLVFLGLAGLCLVLRAGDMAGPLVRIDDPSHLLPADPAWTQHEAAQLEAFEHATGIRIVVQFHAKSPPDDVDKVPGAYMSALSRQLGLIDHGILVVYFGDDPDWRIWFGNSLAPVLVGRPGTAASLTADGSIHNAKEAFLTERLGLADGPAPISGKPAVTPERIAREADSLISGLMARFAGHR